MKDDFSMAESGDPLTCYVADLGVIPYETAWQLQVQLVEARQEGRLDHDVLLFLEHASVLTMGRKGGHENLNVTEAFLESSNVKLLTVERGGDITYHGPGQLILYPIIKLQQGGMGVVDFVDLLEELMIQTVADWGIIAERNQRNRGIWIGNDKLGSIGIAVRRGVTFHGLALNVNPDMRHFDWINPCGLTGVKMTCMAACTKTPPPMSEVKTAMRRHWGNIFKAKLKEIQGDALNEFIQR
jgi:lipoate-protein ligase B